MELVDIPVNFVEDNHEYKNILTGEYYEGITSTILSWLFPDKYSGVPGSVLNRAAEKGKEIHNECQEYAIKGVKPTSAEALNFIGINERLGKAVACEYLISDLVHFASKVDIVYENTDGTASLVEIKTTSVLDVDYAIWQLSIYAHLFELNNDIPASHLYIVWLSGNKKKLVEIQRRDVEGLFKSYAEKHNVETTQRKSKAAQYTKEIIEEYDELKRLYCDVKRMTERIEKIKESIMQRMEDNGLSKLENDELSVNYIPKTEKKIFDSKSFRNDNEALYNEYIKTSTTSASIRIKFKNI